jgi:hypothetical protein
MIGRRLLRRSFDEVFQKLSAELESGIEVADGVSQETSHPAVQHQHIVAFAEFDIEIPCGGRTGDTRLAASTSGAKSSDIIKCD